MLDLDLFQGQTCAFLFHLQISRKWWQIDHTLLNCHQIGTAIYVLSIWHIYIWALPILKVKIMHILTGYFVNDDRQIKLYYCHQIGTTISSTKYHIYIWPWPISNSQWHIHFDGKISYEFDIANIKIAFYHFWLVYLYLTLASSEGQWSRLSIFSWYWPQKLYVVCILYVEHLQLMWMTISFWIESDGLTMELLLIVVCDECNLFRYCKFYWGYSKNVQSIVRLKIWWKKKRNLLSSLYLFSYILSYYIKKM